jgi:pentapeptide MXKDX repeat protein
MNKICQVFAAAVVGLGLTVAIAGCGESTTASKDKMSGDKMSGDKMGKMGGDKMSDKMAGDKMKDDKMKDGTH